MVGDGHPTKDVVLVAGGGAVLNTKMKHKFHRSQGMFVPATYLTGTNIDNHNLKNKSQQLVFLIKLASHDAVNRNKVPICQLSLFIFLPLTTCSGPYGPSSGENIQLMLYEDYSYYNGSAVRTQLDVCLRYFDPWSPIHVIKHKI
jgi:hypothetical protein